MGQCARSPVSCRRCRHAREAADWIGGCASKRSTIRADASGKQLHATVLYGHRSRLSEPRPTNGDVLEQGGASMARRRAFGAVASPSGPASRRTTTRMTKVIDALSDAIHEACFNIGCSVHFDSANWPIPSPTVRQASRVAWFAARAIALRSSCVYRWRASAGCTRSQRFHARLTLRVGRCVPPSVG